MSDLKLDTTHDLAIEGFDFVLVSGADQVVQRLKIKLQTFLGEYFLNTDYGIPYIDEIFIKSPNSNYIEAILRGAILEEPGVDSITQFNLDFDAPSRGLSLTFSVKYGAEELLVEVTL